MKKFAILFFCWAMFMELRAGEITPLHGTFNYKSDLYRVAMWKTGYMQNLLFGNDLIFSAKGITGTYVTTFKGAGRLDQGRAQFIKGTVEEFGKNRFKVICEGRLPNEEFPDGAADYEQTSEFWPDRLKISYKVTTKQVMKIHYRLFASSTNMPLNLMLDRGVAITDENGKRALVVPSVFTKNKEQTFSGFSQIAVSLSNGVCSLSIEGVDSTMQFIDCRQWSPNSTGIIVNSYVAWPWNAQGYEVQADTAIEWSETFAFNPLMEK